MKSRRGSTRSPISFENTSSVSPRRVAEEPAKLLGLEVVHVDLFLASEDEVDQPADLDRLPQAAKASAKESISVFHMTRNHFLRVFTLSVECARRGDLCASHGPTSFLVEIECHDPPIAEPQSRPVHRDLAPREQQSHVGRGT